MFRSRAPPHCRHHVYWSGASGCRARKASTQPASIQRSSSARSSGRNPLCVTFACGGQVDRAVRRVVVADHEHRAPAPEFLRPSEDRPREVELVADPAVVPVRAASLGEVAVDHHEPPAGGLEVPSHEPPLSVEPRHAQGSVHPNRLELRIDADTAIAPALGDRERRVPARRPTGGRRDVLGPRADLLDADDIGAGRRCCAVRKLTRNVPYPQTR